MNSLFKLLLISGGCSVFASNLSPPILIGRDLFDRAVGQLIEAAPVVIIGTIKQVVLIRSDVPVVFEGHSLLVHLAAVTVNAELCLRGDVPDGPVEFLMYVISEKNEGQLGWRTLALKPDRRLVLPLRRDNAVLRPMVDLVDTFPRVTAGLHRATGVPVRNIVEAACRVLMTKGEGVSEETYLDGLSIAAGDCLGWSRQAATRLLKEISASSDPNTGAYACSLRSELVDDFECLCVTWNLKSLLPPVQEALTKQRVRLSRNMRSSVCASGERQ